MNVDLTRRGALALGAAALSAKAWAQPAASAPAMKRGINLHHMLNWPEVKRQGAAIDYVWPPFRTANYKTDDSELRRLSALGFDFVRLTVDPSIAITSKGERWDQLGSTYRQTVDRLVAAGFRVVFDLHPVAVNPEFRPQALIDPNGREVFARYAEAVGRVAAVLATERPDRVAFELMNEPWIDPVDATPRWLVMQEELHRRARAAAPSLPLILTGVQWSSFAALLRVDTAPYRSSNVLYTFHYYDPHSYTHQEVDGETKFLAGLTWPPSRGNADAVLASATSRIASAPTVSAADKPKVTARTKQLLGGMIARGHGPEQVERDFDSVARWATRNGIPESRILLGEFGCVVVSGGDEVKASRLAWLRTVRAAAEKRGMPWAYWALRATAAWSW